MRLFGRKKSRKEKKEVGVIVPPEGVPLKFQVAGLGARFSAQLLDLFITLIALFGILVLLASLKIVEGEAWAAIASLLFLIIRVPYYVFSELAWNGQTIGKRILRIKVVSHDGRSLTAHALILRNLMKEVEVFFPITLAFGVGSGMPWLSLISTLWILMTLSIPLMSAHRRRLGDLMAGTHVIHLPVPILLKDLADEKARSETRAGQYVFQSHQLDHYGAFELQTLEQLLRAQAVRPHKELSANQAETVAVIVDKIRRRIGYANPVPEADRFLFLKAFYQAQREHLEQRQLFGDKRKDKHYSQDDAVV